MSLPIEHDSVSSPHYVPTSDPLEVELVIPPGADVRDSDSATLPSVSFQSQIPLGDIKDRAEKHHAYRTMKVTSMSLGPRSNTALTTPV